MTVINLHEYGRQAGFCDRCGREVGNLARHEPACKREHEKFFAPTLSDAQWRLVERAAAHSIPGGYLDLDIARVFVHFERGGMIMQGGGPYRWRAESGSPLSRIQVGRTVDEMIRTGLAGAVSQHVGNGIYRVHLIPSPVHMRRRGDRLRPKCEAQALRYRLVDHPDLADCPDCLA